MICNIQHIKKSPFYNGLFFRFWGIGILVFLFFQFYRGLTLWFIGWEFDLDNLWRIFKGGLKMDVSTTSYILSYFLSMVGILWFTITNSLKKFFRLIILFNVLLLIGVACVLIADVLLLKYWGSRINSQALSFLKFPLESIQASLNTFQIASISAGVLLFGMGCYIFISKSENRIKRFSRNINNSLSNWFYFIATWFMLVIGIRGGTSKIPLQISEAFVFHGESELNNQLTLNSLWNVFFQLTNSEKHPNIDHIIQFEAKTDFWSKYRGEDKTNSRAIISPIESTQISVKPNVYLFILEGVSAEVSYYFSNSNLNATPKLDELAQSGLGFKQTFACGDRTDKGVATILSGWPGQPWQSILNYPEKYKKLPSLVQSFKNNGYHSSFFYGGNSKFANLKDYLLIMGVEEIIDESEINQMEMDFIFSQSSISHEVYNSNNLDPFKFSNVRYKVKSKLVQSKPLKPVNPFELKGNWGYFDPVVMDVLTEHVVQNKRNKVTKINNSTQPQLNIILTSSTHEPYDINRVFLNRKSVAGNSKYHAEIQKYLQSVRILDQSIYACIKKIQTMDSNALFVLISDHGKYLNTSNTHYGQRNFFHIPFLIYGKPIDQLQKSLNNQEKEELVNRVVSQTDVPSSINSLVFKNKFTNEFEYSRNIFQKNHSGMSWFSMYGVMGIIEKDATYWLSTDKKSQELEMPWDYRDSMTLHMGKKIILDFFSL